MLKYGRIDALFSDDIAFNYYSNQMGYQESDFIRGLRLTQAPLVLKISLDKKHLLAAFNHVIREMSEDGTIEQLISKYSGTSKITVETVE